MLVEKNVLQLLVVGVFHGKLHARPTQMALLNRRQCQIQILDPSMKHTGNNTQNQRFNKLCEVLEVVDP